MTEHLILDQNLDFFNKEKKCTKNSKGTDICNWDYGVLSTDVLQKFEDTCHMIYGGSSISLTIQFPMKMQIILIFTLGLRCALVPAQKTKSVTFYRTYLGWSKRVNGERTKSKEI